MVFQAVEEVLQRSDSMHMVSQMITEGFWFHTIDQNGDQLLLYLAILPLFFEAVLAYHVLKFQPKCIQGIFIG